MSTPLNRRTLLTGAASFAQVARGEYERSVGIGIVGAGNRGTTLLRTLLALPGVKVPAICDINEASLARAQGLAEKAGQARPDGYSSGVEDFR
ncbi:MAG: gfo/Idh/MocA family oxidoreductase, partial [Bryobacteraceae bacterium]